MLTLVQGCTDRAEGSHRDADNAWVLDAPTADERFAILARHQRGFDMAMVEAGYRYNELHWAGLDRNWDYAAYQILKIRIAVNNGTERRPARSASAAMLEPVLDRLDEAVVARDAQAFASGFNRLTMTCNACHTAEQVGFMWVRPPEVRVSPIGAP